MLLVLLRVVVVGDVCIVVVCCMPFCVIVLHLHCSSSRFLSGSITHDFS